MTSVTPREGFRYGAYLFAYWLALLAVSAVLIGTGGALVYLQVQGAWGLDETQGRALAALGGFLAVLGAVVFGSGQLGLLYKLASDAVGTGVPERVSTFAATGSASTDEGDEGGPDTGSGAVVTGTTSAPGTRREASGRTPTSGPSRSPPRSSADADEEEGGESGSSGRPGPGSPESGGPVDGEGDDPSIESPEEVASGSEIAEELGFNRGERPGSGGERRASDRDPADRRSGAAGHSASEDEASVAGHARPESESGSDAGDRPIGDGDEEPVEEDGESGRAEGESEQGRSDGSTGEGGGDG